ncbi:hypothetical protein [Mesobacillus zeae]|uniref:Uncharacterized protein n=1 Tax=Mesobacillus zeae TaxID=1917180 RepID=A0A398AZG6_9BACI|nr:hypothetical protein [Mesobacillus zeae]RID83059.1 hypothetical protein D1970_16180 [Mesobacillus zeae]
MDVPAMHPEWLVTFWMETPGLNQLNAHYTLALLGLFAGVLYFGKRKRQDGILVSDPDEVQFKHLIRKRTLIEDQMAELDKKLAEGSLPTEKYDDESRELSKHLAKVQQDLRQFIQ